MVLWTFGCTSKYPLTCCPGLYRSPSKDEKQEGNDEVGDDDVDPHIERERVHEREKLRRLLLRLPNNKKN